MTYRELLLRLQTLTDEQLGMDVTLYTDTEEFFPGDMMFAGEDQGILDAGHPYFAIQAPQ